MKLVTLRHQGAEYLGIQSGDHVVLPALSTPKEGIPRNMLSLISAGDDGLSMLQKFIDPESTGVRIPLDEATLLAPVPTPPANVICLGWNYQEHIEESASAKVRDRELPEHPVVFTKAVGSVIGPFDPIPLDARFSRQWDWEVELGVIIGKPGRRITESAALDHVFGYTVINDISIRDVQFRHQQFFLGKSADGACPMGPCVVTADDLPDPQALDLSCRVNGETKQASNTRYQIFGVAKTISILSQGMTLRAGDIIATGTPSGVGFARKPPEFLKPGDVVECQVQGIGLLRNPVVESEDPD
jgi:2-keto-4-pentenoate hydratase/2-oxohepta-3-ene-1,7-dioic acid hydratase in catechol pathway